MRKGKVVSMIIFIIALSVSMDLGFNFLYNLVPGRDGIAAHSFMHAAFGIFGDRGWTLERFYGAFEKSVWITFFIMIVNIVIHYISRQKMIPAERTH